MNEQRLLAERYQLQELIAEGMMGPVYRGVDTISGYPVAIKTLRPQILIEHPSLLERFRREGEALRHLDHPNIVKLLAVAEQDHAHYLIMEFVEGGSLYDLLNNQNQLPLETVLEIGLDLADALIRTHRLGIIHRDLKPQNVLISTDGTPRLSDFGIAHYVHRSTISRPGDFAGTLAYIPPETFLGSQPDERADIWAFGVILFQMLTGTLPFDEESTAALIGAILTKPVPDIESIRPHLPIDLYRLIYLMMAKDRDDRISSVRLVGAALEALQRGKPVNLTVKASILTGQAVKTNLPQIPTSFIGRGQEVKHIRQTMANPECRLLTLTGPGGVGKTRLALRVASDLITRYTDGVFFVDLSPITTPELVLNRIGLALGVREGPGRSPMDNLVETLQGSNTLLLLDNFEQIVEAAPLISSLLAKCPTVNILVTSRQPLRLYGESEYTVDPLPVSALTSETSFEVISTNEAVSLFVQRARAASHGFELTEENSSSIAEICVRLDGLPLAIELAAARIKIFSPENILNRLTRSLDILTSGPRDLSERHQTLRGAIDWSYQLLSTDEQKLLEGLSVFHGGSSISAIEEICGSELAVDTLTALESLFDHSLLRQVDSIDEQPRFDMLETIHQYARERLHLRGDEGLYRQRHAAFFVDLAEEGEERLRGPDQEKWSNLLRGEYDNLRTALTWSLDGADPELGLRLSSALAEFWYYEGPISEGERFLNRAMNWIEQSHPSISAKALNAASMMAFAAGEYKKGRAWNNRALSIAAEHNDKANMAWSYFWLSAQATSEPEFWKEGLDYCEKALVLFRELNIDAGLAWGLNQVGELSRLMGDFERAGKAYKESIAVSHAAGDKRREGISLTNMSYVAQHQGNYKDAELFAKRGLRALHSLKLEYHSAIVLSMLAGPLSSQDRPEEAAILLGASLATFERMSISLQPADQGEIDNYISEVRRILGEEVFESTFLRGKLMSTDEAVAYALGDGEES